MPWRQEKGGLSPASMSTSSSGVAGRPRQPVGLPVQLDLGGAASRRAVRGCRVLERVVRQRLEPLDVDPPAGTPQLVAGPAGRRAMNGSGPQTKVSRSAYGAQQRRAARRRSGGPALAVEPVRAPAAGRGAALELAQLGGEDDRAGVAVGVDQGELAGAARPAPT